MFTYDPTSTILMTGPGTFSVTLYNLNFNTTYFFVAVANNSAGQTNGTVLSFTTNDNPDLSKFISYGWTFGFLAALILAMIGAYYIKRKRNE